MSANTSHMNRGLGSLVDSYLRKKLRRDIHPAITRVRDEAEAESTFLKDPGTGLQPGRSVIVDLEEQKDQIPTSAVLVDREDGSDYSLEEVYRDAEQEKLRFQLAMADYESLTSGTKSRTESAAKLHYTWDDVLIEVQRAADTYSEASGMWAKIRKGLCSFGRNAKAFDAWSSLLPAESEYVSVLCGGLKLILGAAARLHDLSANVCDALAEIPILLKETHLVLNIFKRSRDLHQASAALYCAIVAALHHIMLWYREKAIKTVFKSILKQDSYAAQLTDLLTDVRQQANRFGHVVRINSYERIVYTSEMVRAQGVHQQENHSTVVRHLHESSNELQDFRSEFHLAAGNLRLQFTELRAEMMRERRDILAAFLSSNAWIDARTQNVRGPSLPIRRAKSESKLSEVRMSKLDNIISSLDYDGSVLEKDIIASLRSVWQIPRSDQDRLVAAMKSTKLQRWITETTSSAIFLNFNAPRNHHATSYVAAKLADSIYSSTALVLTFFCGSHTDRRKQDPDFGVTGMMRSLISQLLLTYPSFSLQMIRRIQATDPTSIEDLCKIFHLLVSHLPQQATIFCILDNVTSFEENNNLREESVMAVRELIDAVIDTAVDGCCLKLLFTSSRNSQVLYKCLPDPEQDTIWLPIKVPSQGGFTKGKWEGSVGGEVEKLTIL